MGDVRSRLALQLDKAWYGHTGLTMLLRPLSWLFLAISAVRKQAYQLGIRKQSKLAVPVIVVGNLTVGGTGKTPLVIWIARYLKQAGYKPGIISRGYGGKASHWPQQVRPDADPVIVGDEALVISGRTQCPMSVGPDRVAAGNGLLRYSDVDVIISDDGLQHYALAREIEVLVIDGIRRFGNGHCLPAGPLREPVSRKHTVDFIVTNGIAAQGEYAMKLLGNDFVNLRDGSTRQIAEFKGRTLQAIAGIGNPDRFFNFLRASGLRLETRSFPDHCDYTPELLGFASQQTLLMTEKDAVKCRRFAGEDWWYLPLDVELPDEFGLSLINKLEARNG